MKISLSSILIMSTLLLLSSCKDSTDLLEVKPQKQVLTFALTKLDQQHTYKIAPSNLKGLVSSTNGDFVYVLSKEKKGVKVLDVDKGLWPDALGDWTKVPDAQSRKKVNIASENVLGFSSFDDGILFTLSNNKGLVVLKGFGEDNASLYPQGGNNFINAAFTPVMLTKKDDDRFIYLFPARNADAKNILFRSYQEPPKEDNYKAPAWDMSLAKSSTAPLNADFFARTQDADKNLLLADKHGIKRVLEADVGVTNKFLEDDAKPKYAAASFSLDGQTPNHHINTMRLIDDKILVVGLESSSLNTGGIATLDLSDSNARWQHFGKGLGLDVDFIAPETTRRHEKTNLAAIIVVNRKGLLFMNNDGKIIPVVKGMDELTTPNAINDHRAETTDYEKARDGFVGDTLPVNGRFIGAAQDKNATWYLGIAGNNVDDGGVWKLDIKTEQIGDAPIPPSLPN